MQRRKMLKSTAVVATATGLAGCAGILGGCSKPSGDLEDALPSGGDYEMQGDPDTSSEGDGIENGASAAYEGPDGESFFTGVVEYTDEETAKEKIEEGDSPDNGELGYVRVGKYVYFATGPDKDSVKALLSESKPLDSGCVDSNVEWI